MTKTISAGSFGDPRRRGEWVLCRRCRKGVDEITRIVDPTDDAEIFEVRCHGETFAVKVSRVVIRNMRSTKTADILALFFTPERAAFEPAVVVPGGPTMPDALRAFTEAAARLGTSLGALAGPLREFALIAQAAEGFAGRATDADRELARTSPATLAEVVALREMGEQARRAPAASGGPVVYRGVDRRGGVMTVAQWGTDRDDTGVCRVCHAGGNMWCDRVEHDRARPAGVTIQTAAYGAAVSITREELQSAPLDLSAAVRAAAEDAFEIAALAGATPVIGVDVGPTPPVTLSVIRARSTPGSMTFRYDAIANPWTMTAQAGAVERVVAIIRVVQVAWLRAHEGAALFYRILDVTLRAWASSPTLLELDLDGSPAFVQVDDNPDSAARFALLEPYNTEKE